LTRTLRSHTLRSRTLRPRTALVAAAVAAVGLAGTAAAAGVTNGSAANPISASTAKHHPMFLPTIANQWTTAGSNHRALSPPAPPCPESGMLPSPLSNCGLPEFPAVGQPYLGNMAYWGGHVQTKPKVYLILWGWGESGAFTKACSPVQLREGAVKATLRCDPDGAGKRKADFVSQLGGTRWAGLQTQYYESRNGNKVFITNPTNQLGGIWADDINRITKKVSYTQMAQEAQRAAAHFHVTDLTNANFVIAQPQNFSDPIAASDGYCAFHDYTEPTLEGGIYNHVRPGLAYTNMPYLLTQGAGCGQNLVNAGAAGRLDGVTIALGHEIEETVTDPGAEDILPNGTVLGGWFDPFDANENGDKCAYVGENIVIGGSTGEPGSAGNIRGNRGMSFAVQSLWSNMAAEGAGYCAGAGTDLPLPNGTT
jgi:hypothetical protein